MWTEATTKRREKMEKMAEPIKTKQWAPPLGWEGGRGSYPVLDSRSSLRVFKMLSRRFSLCVSILNPPTHRPSFLPRHSADMWCVGERERERGKERERERERDCFHTINFLIENSNLNVNTFQVVLV